MTAVIVSGFPGIGKSVSSRGGHKFLDSDSIHFSWLYDKNGNVQKDQNGEKLRNPEFPNNYMAHIHAALSTSDAIFVSSHKAVRDALVDQGMPFFLVYPQRDLIDEYLERYQGRGSPAEFVDMMRSNWDRFLDELESQSGCRHIVLGKGQYLESVMDKILPNFGIGQDCKPRGPLL